MVKSDNEITKRLKNCEVNLEQAKKMGTIGAITWLNSEIQALKWVLGENGDKSS